MVAIKDYLASLIAGLHQARALADKDAANVALAYAEDELLKHFPVPHFRMSKVELKVPVAIGQLAEKIPDDYQPFEREAFSEAIVNALGQISGVKLEEKKIKPSLIRAIDIQAEFLEDGLKLGRAKDELIALFARAVVQQFMTIISLLNTGELELSEKPNEKKLEKEMSAIISPLVSTPTKVIDLHQTKVIVEAHKLKALRPDNIVMITAMVNEEGLEWHTMEDNQGNIKTKLLPE